MPSKNTTSDYSKQRDNDLQRSDALSHDALSPQSLTDLFDRTISYLRLSITDRCNLRCLYCVSEKDGQPLPMVPQQDMLTTEEMLLILQVAVDIGISKLRLTGGEPLVRPDIIPFLQGLGKISRLQDIRLTTNGVLFQNYATELLEAGVTKVNISLDSLQPEKFARITGRNYFHQVWDSILCALKMGFAPVKINVVAMRGINDDEILDFVALARKYPLQIRFIEFMPMGSSSRWNKDTYMPMGEILAKVEEVATLTPAKRRKTEGPARIYHMDDAPGTMGFISPLSHNFCDQCNRLRVTAEGRLRTCLLHDQEFSLRSILRDTLSLQERQEAIKKLFFHAIATKPQGHKMTNILQEAGHDCQGRMSQIGG